MQGDGVFYGNIIYNNGLAGSFDAGDLAIGNGEYQSSVISFYNNTFFNTTNAASNNKYSIFIDVYAEPNVITGTPTFNFKNNIVYTSNFTPVKDRRNWLTHSNNLIYRNQGASYEHSYNGTSYDRASVLTWEPSAQNTYPFFVGGALPTGFTGNYGINMKPNTDYFSIVSGNAIDNGATLVSPYDGCINRSGLVLSRPQGTAYDIGAYEYKNLLVAPTPRVTTTP
jgi:hypothetical protein